MRKEGSRKHLKNQNIQNQLCINHTRRTYIKAITRRQKHNKKSKITESSRRTSSMANIFLSTRRSMKSKSHEEKRSDSNSKFDNNFSCKKHTKHRQSHGVCSLCLTERLSKLSLEYYDYTKPAAKTASSGCSSSTSSTSVSSCYSSSSISSCSSPLQFGYRAKKKDGKKQSFLFRLLLGSIVD